MEKFRLHDIRRASPCHPPLADQVSMCYYLREQPLTSECIRATTMVRADTDCAHFQYRKDCAITYVSLGIITGPCSLHNKVDSQIDQERMNRMELERLSVLFNHSVSLAEKPKKSTRFLDWSDDDESESNNEEE